MRTLDQSPLSTSGFEVHQVVVARWTPDQIRAYCDCTLGEGNALWPVIADDKSKSLLDLSALPFNLWAQCELFRALGRVATDRAELMGGMFWQMLVPRVGDAPLKVAGLLGEPDRQQIANGKWKQMLRALPEKHGCLVPWLDETMQRLHRLGRQVSVAQDELLAGLEARPGWATPAQWLYAVRSLELIGEGGADEYSTDPKWLTAQAGLPSGSLRPPLEAEWEVAARGGLARRRWPWVGPDPEPGQINDGAARLQRTSPVGVFPQSDTPDGLVDMAGNVLEWTISEYIEEPNQHNAIALVTPVPAGPARRVVERFLGELQCVLSRLARSRRP